eukprot:scaffold966_cov415-Prasinococcus_capsulatus_cf.AAC.20
MVTSDSLPQHAAGLDAAARGAEWSCRHGHEGHHCVSARWVQWYNLLAVAWRASGQWPRAAHAYVRAVPLVRACSPTQPAGRGGAAPDQICPSIGVICGSPHPSWTESGRPVRRPLRTGRDCIRRRE